MMRKAYSFSARGRCSVSGEEIDALCVFFDSRRSISDLAFFDELERSLRETQVLPDCLVVIADRVASATLHSHWTTAKALRETFLDRGRRKGLPFIKRYYFVEWTAGQGLRVTSTEPASGGWTLPLAAFVQQGFNALVATDRVVQVAPAGHVFKHPSRTVNKLFVQARELASSEAEVAFTGRCIAGALPTIADRSVRVVYVDTMGVYALLREALAFADVDANILSFHSYTDVSEMVPPTDEPYAVVISASTSGGMARKLVGERGFDEARILTLIDATKKGRCGTVLAALDGISKAYTAHLSDGTETQIELSGEHFSFKAKPPRAVTLGMPHMPKTLNEFLAQFGIGGLHGLNAQKNGSGGRRVVCADTASVGGNGKLAKWLDQELAWTASVAIDHVICADDAGSQALAALASARLHALRKGAVAPQVSLYSALRKSDLETSTGVLVVQAVAGDGGLLREVSRDLREYLKADFPRHFLIGAGLPQSQETWQRLRQFLVRNPTSREYGFSAWLVLPMGFDGTSTAWSELKSLARRAEVEAPSWSGASSQHIGDCVDLATKAVSAAETTFLPTSSGTALALTDGFLFFGKAFDGRLNEVLPATTYATVAAVLQAARELSSPEHQLRPTGYESVVLSSENFLRFNDNILQACILRAAHPSELDYSSSPRLSQLMKGFLLKVFTRHGSTYGAAALEFAAALASGRMRLVSEDTDGCQTSCRLQVGN